MNFQENENGERGFSIELGSNKHQLSIISIDATDSILIEGTLGKLQCATFVEPEILEVQGCCGVLRVNLRRSEIIVIDSVKNCKGGDSECK